MRAIGAAVAQLSANPYPPEAFQWGEVLRLRVGPYRVMYTVEGDLITILPLTAALTSAGRSRHPSGLPEGSQVGARKVGSSADGARQR